MSDAGYTHPTPIQARAIPDVLAGRDLFGCAQTGTGKTAAFGLPLLQRLAHGASGSAEPPADSLSAARPRARSMSAALPRADFMSAARPRTGPGVRALVLVPTRELAAQVAQDLRGYGRHLHLSVALVHGGVGQGPQVRALARGADVLVATPGRLLDLLQQGHARLGRVEVLVLDEADHMLDLGFLPDVKRILAAVPRARQTLFFSATLPPPIQELARRVLSHPVEVFVTPAATTVEEVEQRVHFVTRNDKVSLLAGLLAEPAVERALVFTRTKRGADRVKRRLVQGGIAAEAIHGNKAQGARERTLAGFRQGRVRVLVATDIAARGLDIDGITHVINYELPNVPETYVHRIGRTARAGARGVAISLCDVDEHESLREIERLIRRPLTAVRSAVPAHVAGRPPRSRTVPARTATHRSRERQSEPARPARRADSGARTPALAIAAPAPVFGAGLHD